MNILFIKPYVYIHPNQNVEIPIGIMALSSWLKKKFGNDISISFFDMRLHKRKSSLIDAVKTNSPDIIGISLLAFERDFLKLYLREIKKTVPDAFIFLGGPLSSSNYEEILKKFPKIDAIVRGEGEITLEKIVRHIMNDTDFHGEDGISFHDGKKVVNNPDRAFIDDINQLPFPDYNLISISSYHGYHAPMNVILKEHRYIQIVTSRSCPYNCIYCHNIFGKGFRPRSSENVFSEIEYLYNEHGIREFQIVDDIFNLKRQRMHHIFKKIIDSDMKIALAFPNAIRGDILSFRDIDLLKAAGCYNLTLSVETASPRIQKLIGKNLNIEKTMKNIRYAHSLGILTRAYFMTGFPGETEDEIRLTLKYAADPALDMMSIFKVTPFINTELHKLAVREYGDKMDGMYGDFFVYRSYFEEITGIPLKKMIRNTYFKFYLPFRIFRTFFKLPRKIHFIRRILYNVLMILSPDKRKR